MAVTLDPCNAVNVSFASSTNFDKDNLFECPFDKTHLIAGKRFVGHIIKCKKNHLEVDLELCPHNHRHMMSKKELEIHIVECPDRYIVEKDLVQTEVEVREEHMFGKDDEWSKDETIEDEENIKEEEQKYDPQKNVCQRRVQILKRKEQLKALKIERYGMRRPAVNPSKLLTSKFFRILQFNKDEAKAESQKQNIKEM